MLWNILIGIHTWPLEWLPGVTSTGYFKFCWFGIIKSCFIKTTHLIQVHIESFEVLYVCWESFTIKTLFILYSLPCIFAEYFCIKSWLMYTHLLVLQYYIVIISHEYSDLPCMKAEFLMSLLVFVFRVGSRICRRGRVDHGEHRAWAYNGGLGWTPQRGPGEAERLLSIFV